MIKKLLYKEVKIAASPLSYWFIAFALMTLIPRYPILISSFFICLGIFYTFQQIREYNDITYTVMLPVRRKDAVMAKYLFVLLIELIAFILFFLLTTIRMKFLGDVEPFISNPLMNANVAYLGYILLVFWVFNYVFLKGFFKTTYKIGKPFILFSITSFFLVIMCEVLHNIPGLNSLNSPSTVSGLQLIVLIFGILVFILGTWTSYKKAIYYFEKIDL